MLPNLSRSYPLDVVSPNANGCGNGLVVSRVQTDGHHIGLRELGVPMSLSPHLTPLGNLVCGIISRGSQKQMLGIAARRIVAVMEDAQGFIHPLGKGGECDLPVDVAEHAVGHSKTIASGSFCALPLPAALVGFDYISDDSLQDRSGIPTIVTIDESKWLSLDVPPLGSGDRGHFGPLATSAVAKSVRYCRGIVRHIGGFFTDLFSGICERRTHLSRDHLSTGHSTLQLAF